MKCATLGHTGHVLGSETKSRNRLHQRNNQADKAVYRSNKMGEASNDTRAHIHTTNVTEAQL